MQRTRLNLLLDQTFSRFTRFFRNPWRRIALTGLALLLGNFTATVFPPAIGQTTSWDPIVAMIIIFLAEITNLIYYRQGDRQSTAPQSKPNQPLPSSRLLLELVNVFKIGLLYGLAVSAINVGS